MDKQTLIRVGEAAQRLLDDEATKMALAAIAEKYKMDWANSAFEDNAGREKLYLKLDAVRAFMTELKILADTSKFEKAQLAKKDKLAKTDKL